MKKIVSGQMLQDKMTEAINLLCDTVKGTLGPEGHNVIIDHSNFSPFITNDGVTIAKNIESEDEVINTILELAKEASINTNDKVGDGTTTTLVLLQSIYNESLKYLKKGISPMILKKELDESIKKLLPIINTFKLDITDERKKYAAIIAAGEEKLGTLVYEVFNKVYTKEAIEISEIEEDNTYVNYLTGYYLDINLASPYFLKDELNIIWDTTYLLIVNDKINDIEYLSDILNDVIHNNYNLLIVAKYFDDCVVNQIVSLNLENNLNCCLVSIADYGLHERIVQKDLAIISNAKIVETALNIKKSDLGIIKHLKINKDNINVSFEENLKINNYIKSLREDINKLQNDIDLSFYQKRLAMFTSGVANIIIGAPTKVELREKRMRLEDAVWAIDTTSYGILPGGGLTLFTLANKIEENNLADQIFKIALNKPIEQILINAGLDYESIKKKIADKQFLKVYNVYNKEYEDILKTKVIDSFKVVVSSLTNACSIAGMLITTNSLVINEYKIPISQINNFNEL